MKDLQDLQAWHSLTICKPDSLIGSWIDARTYTSSLRRCERCHAESWWWSCTCFVAFCSSYDLLQGKLHAIAFAYAACLQFGCALQLTSWFERICSIINRPQIQKTAWNYDDWQTARERGTRRHHTHKWRYDVGRGSEEDGISHLDPSWHVYCNLLDFLPRRTRVVRVVLHD